MKKVKTIAIDAHQPSGPLPIPKEVEKLLENWFSLSGFDNLIIESDCGLVIPAGDAEKLGNAILTYYYMDKDERKRTGNNGRDYLLQNRTFDVLAGQYQKIFLSL